jgi:hypothetical protein
MRRVENLDERIDALGADLSGLLDDYLGVRERLDALEAATGEGVAPETHPAVTLDGETAWPVDAGRPGAEDAVGSGMDGPDPGGDQDEARDDDGEVTPASQAAVDAAVEAMEDSSERSVEREGTAGDDITVA